ncbi:Golgi-associated plant pathogenesis-related protein 1 [Scaptodrosophila lebanonensis]|uniref:Golgi-associated plant pathogenesis-related protein 1 n=1 Tax=Drosophila lebanonensis TaxID=7225 RepID=A0A6J2U7F4_DROLE|nr:Golgi-associated plant pathogenesis-related protein 1 [Scaptodrosophila lebanonensis]
MASEKKSLVSCIKCIPSQSELKKKRPPEPDQFSPDIIKSTVLQEINKYRRMHCACPLQLQEKLMEQAQAWADYLAQKNLLETSPKPIYGQNIMCAHKAMFCVPRMIKLWYQEKYEYNFLKPGFDLYTGHFTQLVWWATQYLGVGVASNEKRIWIVCYFNPPGNVRGLYKNNVLPRKLMLSDSESEDEKKRHRHAKSLYKKLVELEAKLPRARCYEYMKAPCQRRRSFIGAA